MFNSNLKNIRETHGLTQKQMAQKLHIATTTYRNYENTSREPSYSTLIKISRVLGVSIDYLLDNTENGKKNEEILSKLKKLDETSLETVEKYIDFLIYTEKKD